MLEGPKSLPGAEIPGDGSACWPPVEAAGAVKANCASAWKAFPLFPEPVTVCSVNRFCLLKEKVGELETCHSPEAIERGKHFRCTVGVTPQQKKNSKKEETSQSQYQNAGKKRKHGDEALGEPVRDEAETVQCTEHATHTPGRI